METLLLEKPMKISTVSKWVKWKLLIDGQLHVQTGQFWKAFVKRTHFVHSNRVLMAWKWMKCKNRIYELQLHTCIAHVLFVIAKLWLLAARSISYLHFENYWKLFVIFFLQCVNSDGEMGENSFWKSAAQNQSMADQSPCVLYFTLWFHAIWNVKQSNQWNMIFVHGLWLRTRADLL